MPSSKGEDWQPLQLYRNSLLHGESDQPMPTARRAYTRKKKEGSCSQNCLFENLRMKS